MIDDLMDAIDAARELRLLDADGSPSLAKLKRLARRREYPELLHVTRGEYRVRRSDHEAFKAARWTSAEMAREELQAQRDKEALGVRG